MTIYIALLRGVNVGGKNMIKMAELKKMFEALGLLDVQTYIQSGNVLFKSNEDENSLRKKIEHRIEADFGFAATVVLRSAAEMEWIARNCPFSGQEIKEAASGAESLYVSLMTGPPSPDKTNILNFYQSESDRYSITGREVFLLFRYSIRDSKLAGNLHKLGVPATVRNFKTINKLVDLAKAMQVR